MSDDWINALARQVANEAMGMEMDVRCRLNKVGKFHDTAAVLEIMSQEFDEIIRTHMAEHEREKNCPTTTR